MRFDIVSLFPEICEASLGESIIGRANRAGLVEIRSVDLRSYAHDKRGEAPCLGEAAAILSQGAVSQAGSKQVRGSGRLYLKEAPPPGPVGNLTPPD